MVFSFFKRRKVKTVTNALGMELSLIEPGSFMMGSPRDEPDRVNGESLHAVSITRPFLLATMLVSQQQWKYFMGKNPSRFKGFDHLPVDSVSWDDAIAFCRKLSKKDGRTYRLPTEAEWEYACRAGSDTPFWFGDSITPDQANYDGRHAYHKGERGKYRGRTSPVNRFKPNPWGLYDMHGNLWEWCNDWFAKYDTNKSNDPRGALRGEARVVRGGSWQHTPRRARAAARGQEAPDSREDTIGFRVASSDVEG